MVDGRSVTECFRAKEAVPEAIKVLGSIASLSINDPPPVSLSVLVFSPLQIKRIGLSESLVLLTYCVLQWPLSIWI